MTMHYQRHCDRGSRKTYGAHIQSYYTHLRNESQIGPYIYVLYVQKCIIIPPSVDEICMSASCSCSMFANGMLDAHGDGKSFTTWQHSITFLCCLPLKSS